MVKRKRLFIVILILFIALVAGIVIVVNEYPHIKTHIKTFDVSDYECEINDFPSEENLGSISDTRDLLKKVQAIWIKIYGQRIRRQKPYQISYDEKNGIWLVEGTFHSTRKFGGVAKILVDNDTGKVLAVWHGR